MKCFSKPLILVVSFVFLLVWATPISASEDNDGFIVGVDTLLVRPFGLAATLIGTAIFIVALPFSIPTGSTGKAADKLVADPFRYTFTRPLGNFKNRKTDDSMRGLAFTKDQESKNLEGDEK